MSSTLPTKSSAFEVGSKLASMPNNLTNNPSVFKVKQIGLQVVATLLWPSVGVKPNTLKVGDLESSRTPECLQFDSKAQNSSH